MGAALLEFDAIRVTRGAYTHSADLSVPKGARVAVIGPSGSGKSTLLSLVGGFLAPDRGRIRVDGQDITGMPPGRRPVSMLFQDQNLFPHLTVARNLGLGLRPDLRLTAADDARIDEALLRVGLEGLGPRRPAQLSGGQASRAALARALLRARPILLLDEPFAALGPALRAEMLQLVREVADETGALVLMVTHDPQDALALGGDTAFVAEGIVHPPVPTAELLANPPPEVQDYLGRK